MKTTAFAPLRVTGRTLAIPTLICIAAAASAPAHADAVFGGSIYEYYGFGPNPTYLYVYQTGPTTGTTFTWSASCSDCNDWAVSGSGSANFANGTLGASATETVSGTPFVPGVGHVTAGVGTTALYNDMLTITGGVDGTAGVLGLEYSLDGTLSPAGAGAGAAVVFGLNPITAPAGTEVSLNAPSLPVYNGSGNTVGSVGALISNGSAQAINDTLSIYVPITYGSPVSVDPILTAFDVAESTFTGTSDFYNTMTLDGALVFSGAPGDLGAINTDAVISSSSGLQYGPDGITAVPEPGTLALFGLGLGLVAVALSRRRLDGAAGPRGRLLQPKLRVASVVRGPAAAIEIAHGNKLLLAALWICAAMASTAAHADSFVDGLLQNFSNGQEVYVAFQAGSATSDSLTWNANVSGMTGEGGGYIGGGTTCGSACLGITALGNGNVTNGSLGVSVAATFPLSVDSAITAETYSQYSDSLTISNGTGSGVLALTYSLDGSLSESSAGGLTGINAGLLYTPAGTTVSVSGGGVVLDGEALGEFPLVSGSQSDTVTLDVPFTYGSSFSIEPYFAGYTSITDTTAVPFNSDIEFSNTMSLESALVYTGTPAGLSLDSDANISATSGLLYGPDGVTSSVPEPASLALLACGLGLVAVALSRRRLAR